MKKLFVLPLLLVLTLAGVFRASAAGFENVIYGNDFEWGTKDFRVVSTNASGGISTRPAEGGNALRITAGMDQNRVPRTIMAVNSIDTGNDFTFELEMKNGRYDSETSAVLFCVSANQSEYYALSWQQGGVVSYWSNPNIPTLTLCKNSITQGVDGAEQYTLVPLTLESGKQLFGRYEFSPIKITYNNGQIEVYFQNMEEPVISYRDREPLTGGGIGFAVSGSSYSAFGTFVDNVKITAPDNELSEKIRSTLADKTTLMLRSRRALVNGEYEWLDKERYMGKCIINTDGNMMVPAEFFASSNGLYSSENGKKMQLTGNKNLSLEENSRNAVLDGETLTLPSAPERIDGTLYIPLKFTAELYDKVVSWHESGLVTVGSTAYVPEYSEAKALCSFFGKSYVTDKPLLIIETEVTR